MRVLQILVLIFGLSVFINAQNATLSGTVYDANGSVIAGAKVVAISENLTTYFASTNADGVYSMDLPFKKYDSKDTFKTAKYVITVESPGFEKYIMKGLNFVPSTKGLMNFDVGLDIDTKTRVISCPEESSGDFIQIETPKLSSEIIQKPLVKLPKAQNKTKGK